MTMEKITETSNSIEREQIVVSKMSIWGAVITFLISAFVGLAVDSIALILDASSNLVILVGALLTNFSLKKINLPPDELYNFGYSKYEPLTGSVQSGLIIATCIVSVQFAIQDIVHAESVDNYLLPVLASFLSGVLGLLIFLKIKRVAKRTNSQMLNGAGAHWYTDTLMSFGLCLGFIFGLFLERLGYSKLTPYIDPVMAIILALFLIRAPFKILLYNLKELLDIVPDEHIQTKVKKVVEMYKPKSFGVNRMRIRKSGAKIFLDICYIVKRNLTVAEIKELANNFERDLKSYLNNCDVVVYFHPAEI